MRIGYLLFWLLPAWAYAQKPVPPAFHPEPEEALKRYQTTLTQLRQEHPNHRDLPDLKFFLFGMGDRLKLIYRNGRLLNALTGNIEEQWRVEREVIVPSEYLVQLTLAGETPPQSRTIQIREDENGVWILQPDKRPKLIPGTRSRVNLPTFADKAYGPVLRVLHQELLINVINGRPVPNFLVYARPWFRDAALMAMVLRATDNLSLIRDWIMAIRDPFDRNNRGIAEADNLGQVLFLISLVSDKSHPAVAMVLDSVRRFTKDTHIVGRTDYAEHPVFQTKWLKYGLKALNLPDPYVIPAQYDTYSALVWWAYRDQHVAGKKFDDETGRNYPYLVWAEDNFYGQSGASEKRGMVGSLDYPLSWEQQASAAHYPSLTVLERDLVKQKLAFPHTWHAAEMFLLLSQQQLNK
ncbi:hypothetical protein [Fibrisoma limi]|uniref:hypothetical protein n=1 Tax=Fibrisoma limi TaxID=663275 RepID=UPI000302E61D|nr:hypothetical protein [Fibrisoma limi]